MKDHPFKSPLFPLSNYITIIFLTLVLIGMWFNPDTRISLIVGAVFCAIVIVSFYACGMKQRQTNEELEEAQKTVK